MGERRKLEYFLLRYVPDAVRGESLNIGLVMTEIGGDGGGFAAVHFTKDWRRPKCLYPDIDIELLEAIGRDIETRIANVQDRALLLHQMADLYSNAIQFSSVKRCFAEDPVQEMEYLATTLVETPSSDGSPLEAPAPKTFGKKWLYSEMKDKFAKSAVLPLLHRDLPAAPYTVENDPLVFAFSYGHKNEIRLFQPVSLVEHIQEAVQFALHYAKIAPKMAQITERTPRLTAVVEDRYDHRSKHVQFAKALMKQEEVTIAGLAQMPRIAERARIELHA